MHCSLCQAETKVLESRSVGTENIVRRRRQCLSSKCSKRFTTYERIEMPVLQVLKNDGTLESFRYEKLLDGILRATKKTSMTQLQSEELARKIKKEIFALGKTQVKSRKIGAVVIEHLARENKVAYLRFVSVYRRLKTVASFEKELISIKK